MVDPVVLQGSSWWAGAAANLLPQAVVIALLFWFWRSLRSDIDDVGDEVNGVREAVNNNTDELKDLNRSLGRIEGRLEEISQANRTNDTATSTDD